MAEMTPELEKAYVLLSYALNLKSVRAAQVPKTWGSAPGNALSDAGSNRAVGNLRGRTKLYRPLGTFLSRLKANRRPMEGNRASNQSDGCELTINVDKAAAPKVRRLTCQSAKPSLDSPCWWSCNDNEQHVWFAAVSPNQEELRCPFCTTKN